MKVVFATILLLICQLGFAQQADTLVPMAEDFQKEIQSILSFSVPVKLAEEIHKNQQGFIILDAREIEEFELSHIEGALPIGYNQPDFSLVDTVNHSTPVIVYCSVGYRSEKIAERLRRQGFIQVYNLFGGLFEWVNKGYEVVNLKGQATQKVHTYNEDWSQWIVNEKIEKTY